MSSLICCFILEQVPGIPRVARKHTTVTGPDGKELHIETGDQVWISMKELNMSPEIWKNPEQIDVHRKASAYTIFSVGMHNCLGSKNVNVAQPAMLREIMKLRNVRRAPGKSGEL